MLDGPPPAGFKRLHAEAVTAGEFAAVRNAILHFAQYPSWTQVFDTTDPATVGARYVVCIRHFGVYSLNAFAIAAIEDEPDRFALTITTLHAHAEAGEERFSVQREGETLRVQIVSYSRPRQLLARLSAPLVRMLQKRFLRQAIEKLATA